MNPMRPQPLQSGIHTTVTPGLQLARGVEAQISGDRPLSSAGLFALAADAYGGTLSEGAFTPRDAYDAAELGLHLHLLRTVGCLPPEAADAHDTLVKVERLSGLLPSQTRRTAEQKDFQQFSTPAAYAGLCAWVSGVGDEQYVLEPSAGTGALCAFALAAGASVHANELSDRRADLLAVLLAEAGQDPSQTLTRENADHLDAILPTSVRADVVLMNPPFSQTAGRLGSRRVPTVGTDHVLQALRRLDAGGRLVAILSAGVRRGKPTHRAFFEAVDADPFRLRADVEVGGAVYRQYGTSVRTRLLVVDRMEEEPNDERGPVEAIFEAVEDAMGALDSVRRGRDERPKGVGGWQRPPVDQALEIRHRTPPGGARRRRGGGASRAPRSGCRGGKRPGRGRPPPRP